jgi:hypothetical protein
VFGDFSVEVGRFFEQLRREMNKPPRSVVSLCAWLAMTQMSITAFCAGEPDHAVTTIPAPPGARPIVARLDPSGTIHLLCDSADGPRYTRSTDHGRTFSAVLPVVDRRPRPSGLEFSAWDMAVGKDGRVHVALGTNAWKLKRPAEEWGFHYTTLDSGADAFAPVRNINHKPSEGFSLAADDRGNVAACWLADRMFVNVSHDNGETFAQYEEIDSHYNPCNCCTTSAAYARDGRLAVLYREETNNERDMYLVLWDPARGQSTRTRVSRTPWTVNACPMTYYTVTPTREGFAAAWPTRGQVYFTRLDPAGNPALPEIKTPGGAGMRTGVLALSAPDGTALVAWKKDGELGWQLYDAAGRPSGAPGSVPSPGNGAAGVVDQDGRFLLFR